MLGLNEDRLVDMLEALYALDRSDEEWLSQALLALSKLCGLERHVGFFYDASDVDNLRMFNLCRLQTPMRELEGVPLVLRSLITPAFVRATFRSLFVGSGRRSALEYVRPVLAERERSGHGDFYYLNGLDTSGLGCVMTFSGRVAELEYGSRETALLKRVATHLSAAYRIRRRLSEAGAARRANDSPEAIVDVRGRILHAEGAAREPDARGQIENAARAIESVRSPSNRTRGAAALSRWHPLVSARWTLIDSFEHGGRRYLVARENQVDVPDFNTLTDRERQVVVNAALGMTNKEIAYCLGISENTVRVLTARAAKRLGVRTRRELLRHSMVSAIRPAQ